MPHDKNNYNITFSPFRSFSREEWKSLSKAEEYPLVDLNLPELKGLNEPLTIEEVQDIYVPLSHLLGIYYDNYLLMHTNLDSFFKNESMRIPFIIGLAGSVAVGKSTTARIIQKLLSRLPGNPQVELITTDGFLYPNKELQKKGILDKKGFPESYDALRLMKFISSVKSGNSIVDVPLYSHLTYDVLPETMTIRNPDILIVEGINVLQVDPGNQYKKRKTIFISDFFDFSIFVDASEKYIRDWYIERFLQLQKTTFQSETSFFHRYSELTEKEATDLAIEIWKKINLPNLEENILPSRFRADLILEKGQQHFVKNVRIRKL